MSIRVIPRLDIKAPNLVKGINLEGIRVLGDPAEFARFYYEQGADELLYVDVVASLYDRNNILDIVEHTSRDVFIPMTVGGGLRSLDDIRAVLGAGADKVAINTAAIKRPEFVREAASRFGSSTIVVNIEAKRRPDGSYEAYIDCGRQRTGLEAVRWAEQAAELGAGEILIVSVDREGTGTGFDIDLTREIAERVSIPVIAGGGAGQLQHLCEVAKAGKADAVSIASMLHYQHLSEHSARKDSGRGQGGDLRRAPSRVELHDIMHIKKDLLSHGVMCRPRVSDSEAA